jgi:hypothetical protein
MLKNDENIQKISSLYTRHFTECASNHFPYRETQSKQYVKAKICSGLNFERIQADLCSIP